MKIKKQPLTVTDQPLQHLFEAMNSIQTPEEAQLFLTDLCTPAELQSMADRLRVVALIKAGIPYRKIYDETGVSVTTIGRVARCISHGAGGYDLINERVEQCNDFE